MAAFLRRAWIQSALVSDLDSRPKNPVVQLIFIDVRNELTESEDADSSFFFARLNDKQLWITALFTAPAVREFEDESTRAFVEIRGGLLSLTKYDVTWLNPTMPAIIVHSFKFIGSEGIHNLGSPIECINDPKVAAIAPASVEDSPPVESQYPESEQVTAEAINMLEFVQDMPPVSASQLPANTQQIGTETQQYLDDIVETVREDMSPSTDVAEVNVGSSSDMGKASATKSLGTENTHELTESQQEDDPELTYADCYCNPKLLQQFRIGVTENSSGIAEQITICAEHHQDSSGHLDQDQRSSGHITLEQSSSEPKFPIGEGGGLLTDTTDDYDDSQIQSNDLKSGDEQTQTGHKDSIGDEKLRDNSTDMFIDHQQNYSPNSSAHLSNIDGGSQQCLQHETPFKQPVDENVTASNRTKAMLPSNDSQGGSLVDAFGEERESSPGYLMNESQTSPPPTQLPALEPSPNVENEIKTASTSTKTDINAVDGFQPSPVSSQLSPLNRKITVAASPRAAPECEMGYFQSSPLPHQALDLQTPSHVSQQTSTKSSLASNLQVNLFSDEIYPLTVESQRTLELVGFYLRQLRHDGVEKVL